MTVPGSVNGHVCRARRGSWSGTAAMLQPLLASQFICIGSASAPSSRSHSLRYFSLSLALRPFTSCLPSCQPSPGPRLRALWMGNPARALAWAPAPPSCRLDPPLRAQILHPGFPSLVPGTPASRWCGCSRGQWTGSDSLERTAGSCRSTAGGLQSRASGMLPPDALSWQMPLLFLTHAHGERHQQTPGSAGVPAPLRGQQGREGRGAGA